MLGDSVTLAAGNLIEKTFPFLVEQRIKAARGEAWAVLNLGMDGLNVREYHLNSKTRAFKYRPRLVVTNIFLNDAGEELDWLTVQFGKGEGLTTRSNMLLTHCRLFSFVAAHLSAWH